VSGSHAHGVPNEDATGALAIAKECHSLESFATGEERAEGNNQDIEQGMRLRPLNPRVLSGLAMRDD